MVVSDGGSVTEVNDAQPKKARLPMVVNDGGSGTEVNDLQL